MSKLERLLDIAEASARAILEGGADSLLPVFVCACASGECFIVGCQWTDEAEKVAALDTLRRVFRIKDVVAYAATLEAWTALQIAGDHRQPSQRDDRQEVVLFMATDGTDTILREYAIERDANANIRLGAKINGELVDGRMMGLLS